MRPIVESLIFGEVIVWDNSKLPDLKTSGRYAAAAQATNEVVWFQDDDVIVPSATQSSMCRLYQDGEMLSNMEIDWHKDGYTKLAWFGWGSLIRRDLPQSAFSRWRQAGHETISTPFRIVGCDIIASMLTPHRRVAFAYRHLPHAFGPGRAYTEEGFPEWKSDFYGKALALTEHEEDAIEHGG